MKYWIDWHDLALFRRLDATTSEQIFAVRCELCRRWTAGCREHWFCGLCEPCRRAVEADGEGEPIEPKEDVAGMCDERGIDARARS